MRKVGIRGVCGFPSAVGNSALGSFPRSGFLHSSLTHRYPCTSPSCCHIHRFLDSLVPMPWKLKFPRLRRGYRRPIPAELPAQGRYWGNSQRGRAGFHPHSHPLSQEDRHSQAVGAQSRENLLAKVFIQSEQSDARTLRSRILVQPGIRRFFSSRARARSILRG